MFNMAPGSADGQEIWETLGILVALKLWAKEFALKRISLQVRGDNAGALVLLIKMRPRTSHLAIIDRGLALFLATSSFPPRVIHTPGIAHVVADTLSRVFSPEGGGVVDNSLHPALADAMLSTPPERTPEWYLAYK